jgi:hypothetical protein
VAVISSALAGVAARRRRAEAALPTPPAASGGAWTAAGGLAAAFPIERTRHERNIGDAAFVDGLIVARYYLGDDRREDSSLVRDERELLDGSESPEVLADPGPAAASANDVVADGPPGYAHDVPPDGSEDDLGDGFEDDDSFGGTLSDDLDDVLGDVGDGFDDDW